jgi:pimeloyl-ACP methyl ester carboxylesterase
MHYTGTMDHWDPAVTDGFAREREVILFNNAGVSSSSGEVPRRVAGMARHAAAFIDALGLAQVDVLGLSMGGFVAQQLALDRPELVRRLILVATGPHGGEGMETLTQEALTIFGGVYEQPDDLWLNVFFTPSEASQAAGREFVKRFHARTEDRDPAVSAMVVPSQLIALEEWGEARADGFAYLKKIRQPVLVVSGGDDVIIYTVNSYLLQQNLPNAQLILYPDASHGAPYQYPELFVAHATMFLESSSA